MRWWDDSTSKEETIFSLSNSQSNSLMFLFSSIHFFSFFFWRCAVAELFNSPMQQDAQEFLNYLLNRVSELVVAQGTTRMWSPSWYILRLMMNTALIVWTLPFLVWRGSDYHPPLSCSIFTIKPCPLSVSSSSSILSDDDLTSILLHSYYTAVYTIIPCPSSIILNRIS
jgi:hypothetical protein